MKKNRGITLIALIITVILLLILVGVSVNVIIKGNLFSNAQNGWIDEKKIVMENMIGMKRAGADIIITYHALDVAKWLDEEE